MGKVIKEVAGGVLRREGKILVMRRAPFLSWAGSLNTGKPRSNAWSGSFLKS